MRSSRKTNQPQPEPPDENHSDQTARREFVERRRKIIGGSDAPALCGVDQYKTPYQVWLSKVGLDVPDDSKEAAFWGHYLEDPIAHHALDKIREQYPAAMMRRDDRLLIHPKHPFIGGNIDRRIKLDSSNYAVLEVKTRSAYFVNQWAGTMPDDVYVQATHYESVDPRFVGSFVAALIGGNKFVLRWIPRNEDIIANLTEVEVKFWRTYVEPKLAPPVTALETDKNLLKYLYGEGDDSTVTLDENLALPLIATYERTAAQLKALGDKHSEASNKLKQMIGKATFANVGERKIKVIRYDQNRLDVEKLEHEHPAITEQYRSPIRIVRLKIS